MAEWHHQLDRYEFEQAPGIGDGQGGLGCCAPWGHKDSDTTEQLNWTDYQHCPFEGPGSEQDTKGSFRLGHHSFWERYIWYNKQTWTVNSCLSYCRCSQNWTASFQLMNLKLVCIFIFLVFLLPCLINHSLKLQRLKTALGKERVGRNSLRKIFVTFIYYMYPGGSVIKNPPAVQESQVRSLGWEYPLEEGMATHSCILTWEMPWTEEPVPTYCVLMGYSPWGSRVGHDWATNPFTFASYI